jgi:hypothetical protein
VHLSVGDALGMGENAVGPSFALSAKGGLFHLSRLRFSLQASSRRRGTPNTPSGQWFPYPKRSSFLFKELFVQYGSSLAFQTFHDYLGFLRLDSHFFQGYAKVLEEQVEVLIAQTVISGAGMGVMNTLPCIHSSAEEHGNEHSLSGPEVCNVNALKEMAQAIIMQDLVIEEFSSSLDGGTSPDQVK